MAREGYPLPVTDSPARLASLAAFLAVGPATRDDVPAILRLLADDDRAAHPERAGYDDLAPYLEAFDDIAVDPRTALYVARLGERVVGTFHLAILRHSPTAERASPRSSLSMSCPTCAGEASARR
jgi:hypothetical protein